MNRPQSLSDVATSARNDIHGFASALAELLDEFYLDAEDVDRQARLDSRPTPTDDAEVNSWLGAVGEHLARRWNLRVPRWVEEPVFMGQDCPRFYPPSANLRGLLIVESPPAFRRRLLFTFAEPLLRARFPARRKAVMPFSLNSPAAPEN